MAEVLARQCEIAVFGQLNPGALLGIRIQGASFSFTATNPALVPAPVSSAFGRAAEYVCPQKVVHERF